MIYWISCFSSILVSFSDHSPNGNPIIHRKITAARKNYTPLSLVISHARVQGVWPDVAGQ